jgi:molybdenum cofactor cytidylyltransferase
VVTGHRAGELEESLRLHFPSVETCYNPHFASGEMLSSLKAGIAALQAGEPAPDRSFLLALGDQPAVQPETIARLVAAFVNAVAQRPPLVIPAHAGKRGHPLVLSAGLIPAIQALAPGDSLKSVVHQHLAQALLLPVDDPATLEDLDTPADLARARDRWQTSMSADLSSHGDFFSPVMHGDAHG